MRARGCAVRRRLSSWIARRKYASASAGWPRASSPSPSAVHASGSQRGGGDDHGAAIDQRPQRIDRALGLDQAASAPRPQAARPAALRRPPSARLSSIAIARPFCASRIAAFMCAASASTSGEIGSPLRARPSGASNSRRFFARRLAAATGSAARALTISCAAVGVEYRRVDAPIFADMVRFGIDHDRSTGRRAQFRDTGVRTRVRDRRERRFVRHDRVTRHARQRRCADRHDAEPHPAVVGGHAVYVRRRDEDQARHGSARSDDRCCGRSVSGFRISTMRERDDADATAISARNVEPAIAPIGVDAPHADLVVVATCVVDDRGCCRAPRRLAPHFADSGGARALAAPRTTSLRSSVRPIDSRYRDDGADRSSAHCRRRRTRGALSARPARALRHRRRRGPRPLKAARRVRPRAGGSARDRRSSRIHGCRSRRRRPRAAGGACRGSARNR